MTNVTVQEALKVAIRHIEANYMLTSDEESLSDLNQCKAALSDIEKCEPVGYLIASQDGVRVFFDSPVSFKNHTITPVYTSPISKELSTPAESLQAFENDVESNLKIAVSALKDIAETNASKHGTSQMMIKRCMFIANDALKQIEVK